MRLLCRATLFLCVVLPLVACNIERPRRVDGQIELGSLPSPEFKGINKTLLENAREAEQASEYKRAAQLYRQLLDGEKENAPRLLLGYAENTRKAGIEDLGIGTYDVILGLEPENIDALEGKGLALMAKGEFEEAGDTFATVIKQDKTRWRTLNALAILFVTREQYEDAMAYYTEALVHSKNNVSVLNNVGLTYAIEGRAEDAIDTLLKAVELTPSNHAQREHIEMNLALVYATSGDLKAAKRIASRYLSGPRLNNNLGFYAHLADNDALAKSYLNMALSQNPRYYSRAWKNLESLERQENEAKAASSGKKGKRIKIN